MASVVKRPNGRRWVQIRWSGKRHTIRLGKATEGQAREAAQHLDSLASALTMGAAVPRRTAAWVAGLSPTVRARVAATGMIPPAAAGTLGELVAAYTDSLSVSASTLVKVGNATRGLLAYFDADRPLNSITAGDAKQFAAWLAKSGHTNEGVLASSTVSRRCGRIREMFGFAVAKQWLAANPFAGIRRTKEADRSRDHFVDRETINRILEASSCLEFRAVVALARFGGLRTPSEILSLTWDAVDFDGDWLLVDDVKRKDVRRVPLFAEMQPHLDALWQDAPEGEGRLLPELHGITGAALRNRLAKICKRLGIKLWPKPWQNMRATRETELLDEFAPHIVHQWIGHTGQVSADHYAQITKEHHARAVSGCVPGDATLMGGRPQNPAPKSEAKSEARKGAAT